MDAWGGLAPAVVAIWTELKWRLVLKPFDVGVVCVRTSICFHNFFNEQYCLVEFHCLSDPFCTTSGSDTTNDFVQWPVFSAHNDD